MKEKIQRLLFGAVISLCLGISVYIVEFEANSLIFPLIMEPLIIVDQPHPPEPEMDAQPGTQPDPETPTDNPPLCAPAAACVSVCMLNSNAGRDLCNMIIKILSEACAPQDLFSLLFFNNQRGLTTMSMKTLGTEVENLLDAVLRLSVKGGNRRFFSPLFEELIRIVSSDDDLLIISDYLVETGVRAEGVSESEQAIRIINADASSALTPPRIRIGDNPYQWLTAKVVTLDQLHAGVPALRINSLREAISSRNDRLNHSNASPLVVLIGILLVSFVFVSGFVMIRRLRPAPYATAKKYSYYMLRVSWNSPFEGFEELPIQGSGTELTIGSDEADTIYSPDLVTGHIKVKVGDDALALTCHGSIRLEDGTVVEPFGKESAVERFPINQDLLFSAGDAVFVLKRIQYKRNNSGDPEPVF
jgi:hypothetical protein